LCAAQDWKAERKVQDYSISQVTLEQVFLNLTHDDTSKTPGPSSTPADAL
jgi:hypothetical protein